MAELEKKKKKEGSSDTNSSSSSKTNSSDRSSKQAKKDEKPATDQKPSGGIFDQILIILFACFWFGLIIYFNFFHVYKEPKVAGKNGHKLMIDGDLEEL